MLKTIVLFRCIQESRIFRIQGFLKLSKYSKFQTSRGVDAILVISSKIAGLNYKIRQKKKIKIFYFFFCPLPSTSCLLTNQLSPVQKKNQAALLLNLLAALLIIFGFEIQDLKEQSRYDDLANVIPS